jgi:hypothetical protein
MSSPEPKPLRGSGLRVTELAGRRVELHPATDRWMAGDRFGTIIGGVRGRDSVYLVHLDRSDTTVRLHSDYFTLLEDR